MFSSVLPSVPSSSVTVAYSGVLAGEHVAELPTCAVEGASCDYQCCTRRARQRVEVHRCDSADTKVDAGGEKPRQP